jgi:Methyltransferase domain
VARVPGPLKRWLLPFWNRGHQLAWRLGEVAGAVRHRRFERCAVCGRWGPMLYRRWVIPPRLEELWGLSPIVAEALAKKESLDCYWCGAKLRARRLSSVLLKTIPTSTGEAPSVRAWASDPRVQLLHIGEINIIEGMHEELRRLPNLAYSEFREGDEPGRERDGIRCEDLTRLTYDDESFDVVLTSETLEHVPDLKRALSEIARVLKPRGWHLFTIPLMPGVPKTYARAEIDSAGHLIHHTHPIRHPGGDVGYPVFTEFGADVPEILGRSGFEVEELFGPVSERDVAQVFRCRKPVGPLQLDNADSQAGERGASAP